MNKANKSIFAIYKTKEGVEDGLKILTAQGFRRDRISVLLPEDQGAQEISITKDPKAPEMATAGASSGAFVGGAVGLLIGLGSIAIPGIGPFIAAGPLMTSLAGIGVGGTVGIISGALIGYGIPEYEAQIYESYLKTGKILISVHVDSIEDLKKAKHLLEDSGATDISTTHGLNVIETYQMNVSKSKKIFNKDFFKHTT